MNVSYKEGLLHAVIQGPKTNPFSGFKVLSGFRVLYGMLCSQPAERELRNTQDGGEVLEASLCKVPITSIHIPTHHPTARKLVSAV